MAKHPVHSARQLLRRLKPGETGCLRSGTYSSPSAPQLKLQTPGITLRSFPGVRATIAGPVWITRDAPDATLAHLTLNGTNTRRIPSPIISANRAALRGNNITNDHNGICVSLGARGYGRPKGAVIARNRIHDCGQRDPVTNLEHGIYVAYAKRTVIRNNVIFNNADRGIQLYPNAQGTRVVGNVIDGNGEGVIFGGSGDHATSHTRLERNLITNSQVRGNVESTYPSGTPVGRDNVVRYNCISGAADGYPGLDPSGVQNPQRGFKAANNVEARPGYIDREHGKFRLSKHSPCRGLGRPVRLKAPASHPNILAGVVPGAMGGAVHTLEIQERMAGSWTPVATRNVATRRFRVGLGGVDGAEGPTLVRVALTGRPHSNAVRVRIVSRHKHR